MNAFLASNPLPPEYGALEMTHAEPWTALDSAAVAKLIAFGLSFDLSDIDLRTYRQLDRRWRDWGEVVADCSALASAMLTLLAAEAAD